MKKRELVRKILRAGFIPYRDSQRHEMYIRDGIIISLGRHDTVKPREVRDALKKMEKKNGSS